MVQISKQIVVTAYYKESRDIIERCIASVQAQSVPTDHILVADGHPQDWIDALPVRHIRLDRSHGDYGNTPRGVGALLAISEGYAGIGFLDADNWLEPGHIAACVATERDHPDADFLIAKWNLRRPDGTVMPLPWNLFPDHVDTNCFFFLPGSYHMISHFSVMPKEFSIVGDKVFYLAIKGVKLSSALLPEPTVNYHCLWPSLYRMVGEEPPADAKPDISTAHIDPWLKARSPRELEIISRRAGVRFVTG